MSSARLSKRLAGSAAALLVVGCSGGAATSAAAYPATADPRATTGAWAGPFPLSNIMQHAILLPGSSSILYFESGANAHVVDANTAAVTAVPVASNLFCAGHTFLPDGRPITIGGDNEVNGAVGLVDTNLFSPASRTWSRVADMTYKRWYPTAVLLPSGKVIAISGAHDGCLTCFQPVPEVYDPTANAWTPLPAASQAIPYYPFVYVLADGRLLQIGATENATTTQVLDLVTQQWSVLDARVIDAGSSAMYGPTRFLKAGTASDGNTPVRPASAATWTLDLAAPTPAWQQVASMAFPRAFLNLTTLPDGTVLATGGETTADGTLVANAVYAAESWSPATQAWTTLASMTVPRLYHSVALLLPDGRVLVGGSGNDGAVPNEPNYEIFSPPYLFRGPRPTIASAPASIPYAGAFSVATPDAASVTSVVLISPASVTHGYNAGGRYVPLSFAAGSGSLQVQGPANANAAPPGWYMLFLVDGTGVPSVSTWIQVTADPTPPTVSITAPAPGATLTGAVTVSATASDNVGVTGVQFLLDGNPLGGRVTGAPYQITWDTRSAPNGPHALSAQAFDASGNVGLSAAVSVTVANPTAVGITQDALVFKDGHGTVTSPAFSTTAANELLVALVASDGPTSGGQSVTVSGAGLTWTLAKRANGQYGDAEVWTATAPTALSSATVQSTPSKGGYDQSLTVVALAGAAGPGAVAGASAASGAPQTSIVTTGAGSWVLGVGNDWDNAIARTLLVGEVLLHEWKDVTTGDDFWSQRTVAVASSGTAVTLGDTAPTGDRWNLVALEVRAQSADQAPPSAPGPLTANGGIGNAVLTWGPATDNVGVTGYLVYRATSPGVAPGPATLVAQVAATSYTDAGLFAGSYYYQVAAKDAAGNVGPPTNEAVALVTADTSPPTVSITAPAAGSIASAVVIVSASATDNVGVTGVQLLLDGAPLGARLAAPPYQVSWDTRTASNGTHTLGARAFDASGNVGTASPVTVTVSNTAPAGISLDTTVFKDGHGAQTTAAFSTAGPNELLLALVASDGPPTGSQSVTVSGAGLAWTLVRRANAQPGSAEIWQAVATTALANVTVSSTPAAGGYDQSLVVVALAGASGAGASAAGSASSGAPGVSLTATAAGSWVFGVGNDWDSATARTLATVQTLVHEWRDTGTGDDFWAQRLSATTSGSGATAPIADTAPTGDRWNLAAVEAVAR